MVVLKSSSPQNLGSVGQNLGPRHIYPDINGRWLNLRFLTFQKGNVVRIACAGEWWCYDRRSKSSRLSKTNLSPPTPARRWRICSECRTPRVSCCSEAARTPPSIEMTIGRNKVQVQCTNDSSSSKEGKLMR